MKWSTASWESNWIMLQGCRWRYRSTWDGFQALAPWQKLIKIWYSTFPTEAICLNWNWMYKMWNYVAFKLQEKYHIAAFTNIHCLLGGVMVDSICEVTSKKHDSTARYYVLWNEMHWLKEKQLCSIFIQISTEKVNTHLLFFLNKLDSLG